MGWLSWVVVGLVAGFLAGVAVRGGGYGILGDIIVGVVGGLLGGWLATSVFNIPGATVTGINLPSILVAFVGAVILIIVLRMLGGRRRV